MVRMEKMTMKEVLDSVSEQRVVDGDLCTFAVMDRSTASAPSLFVTTKQNEELSQLPGWTISLHGSKNQLKRFHVTLTKADLLEQLQRFYENHEVCWIK